VFSSTPRTPSRPGVTGVAEIAREGYPDTYAFKKGHKYFDPKSDPAIRPGTWSISAFVEKFPGIVSLAELKEAKGLEKMVVVQKGSRLSVQPVTRKEHEIVLELGRQKG